MISLESLFFGAPRLTIYSNWTSQRIFMNIAVIYLLTHALDRLTGDGSLRPPDVAITSHVPSSICSEPDIDLQLADPSLSGTTSRTFPRRSDIRSVTGTGDDNQTECFMRCGTDSCRRRIHDRMLRFACLGFCCGCFVAGSGSLLKRLAQSRTGVFQESVVSRTSERKGLELLFVRLC